MSAPVVQLPPGCKIVEAPSAPQTAALFEGYPDLLTPDDMSEIIRQSAQTVRKLMRTGLFPTPSRSGLTGTWRRPTSPSSWRGAIVEQLKRGAGRETLASAAASPAQIGRGDHSTAGGQPDASRSATESQPEANQKAAQAYAAAGAQAYAPAGARAYARRTRAEIERDMAEAMALQNEYRAARGAELAAKCADWMDANPDAALHRAAGA